MIGTEIVKGLPQATFIKPFFFNMFLNDLFLLFKKRNICSYANDTTPYACDQNLNQLIKMIRVKLCFINYMALE